MELWDAFDSSFSRIENSVLVRGEAIPEGFFHLVCDILVKHIDGTYLLMQRDYGKHLGGMWEASAGGSAFAGEDAFRCAIRELREETGIISNHLVEIGKEISREKHSIYVEYLCITDWNKDEITLQNGETMDYKWVSREELLSLRYELAANRTLRCMFEGIGQFDVPTLK